MRQALGRRWPTLAQPEERAIGRRVPRLQLMWKWEEGFQEGETPVGPVWLDTLGDDGKAIHTEKVADGEWIPRDVAIRLADEKGYELFLDE